MPEPVILHVSDTVEVGRYGRRKIERIDICLRPTEDPAAETHFANVEALEIGEHAPFFVVGIEGGGWAYGIEVNAGTVEAGDREGSEA